MKAEHTNWRIDPALALVTRDPGIFFFCNFFAPDSKVAGKSRFG